MVEHPISYAEVMFRPGKPKYATTVYHVIWAELSDGMLTVSFVKKKTQTVCIKARSWGSVREEAVRWVEYLLNITYKGTIPTLSLGVGMNFARARHQAEQETMVLVNQFYRKVSHAFHSRSECLTIYPDSEPVPVPN